MMKTVELSNKEVIAYREIGSGHHVLVMLHGNMTSSKHLELFSKYVTDDVKIILPDMRGFGESSYKKSVDSLDDFASDIIELIDHLGLKKFSIGGWSTGGGVAMIIAAKQKSQVEKLILIESVGTTGYPMFKKDATGQAILTEFLKTKEDVAVDPVQVLPILNAYKNKDKTTLKAIWNALIYTHKKPTDAVYEAYLDDMLTQRNLIDVDYALMYFNISDSHNGYVQGNNLVKEITCPTLVVQGNRDFVVPMVMCDSILSGIEAEVTLKKGDWGHSPFVDIEEEICQTIIDFYQNK